MSAIGKKISKKVRSLGKKLGRGALSLGMKAKDVLKKGDVVLRKTQNTLQNVVNPLLQKTGVGELQALGNLSLEGVKGLREGGRQASKGIERLEKSNARKVLEDLAEERNPISSFI